MSIPVSYPSLAHLTTFPCFQTLWTSSEAEPSAEGSAPAEKKDEATPAEAEKPAEQ